MSEVLRDRLILCFPTIFAIVAGLVGLKALLFFYPLSLWIYVLAYVPGGFIAGALFNFPPFRSALLRESQRIRKNSRPNPEKR